MTSLRALLPRTFTAFFHRFPRPTPVQGEGIEPILEGENVLLCAPTASGKTEAYAAPLAERLLAGGWGPMSLLVVSPTRALANDLKRRLEGPMLQAGVSLGRYTGEHKEKRGGTFPRAVVTTPEALDSLLARRPQVLEGLRALVLDEIHVLDGTSRGDQVRLLLERLRRLREEGFQRVGASATVHDPEGLAARYGFADRLVLAPGKRRIRARAFQGVTPFDTISHLDILAKAGFRKILAFCNSRNAVETFASALRGKSRFKDKVFAHHGSLAKGERERTERLFLESPAGVCFATLTLELGIDIGTVDYVLLLEPPPSVSNLLQRIGRGSRRAGDTRVGYAFADEGQRVLFRTLLELASRGDLAEDPYAFRPGAILQQALVLAGSEGHVEASMLEEILPPSLRAELGGVSPGEILEKAGEAGLLEKAGAGRYVLTEKTDRLYRKGRLHSNFSPDRSIPVIDRLTGDEVGRMAPGEGPGREDIRLGGRGRRFVGEREGRILTDLGGRDQKARFLSRPGPFTSLAFARALAERLGAGKETLLQARGRAGWILVHGLGSAGGDLLAWLLARALGRSEVGEPTAFTLPLKGPLEKLPLPGAKEIALFVRDREQRLTAHLGMGPYQVHLPTELRRRAVQAAANLDGLARFLARASLETLPGPPPKTWETL